MNPTVLVLKCHSLTTQTDVNKEKKKKLKDNVLRQTIMQPRENKAATKRVSFAKGDTL